MQVVLVDFGHEDDTAWRCDCGHIQFDGKCCDECWTEPEWGCDCEFCELMKLDAVPDELLA